MGVRSIRHNMNMNTSILNMNSSILNMNSSILNMNTSILNMNSSILNVSVYHITHLLDGIQCDAS